jgi:alpha-glucosidase
MLRTGILLVATLACAGHSWGDTGDNGDKGDEGDKDGQGHPWWMHAVFYEIYPRSFADSNDDGVGDLRGIAGKMAYLRELGVDAVWLTPCFPSPQVDFGYDVSNYQDIDPMYGTLADFDSMVAKGRQERIKIILDLVVNHTSDRHPWFLDSQSSRTAVHRDWYIWRDGKSSKQPPNNWVSLFGGSAWAFDPTTEQYYYHYFYAQQPDLNWRAPAVESAMLDVTRWWYQRGVAGFRLDAVDRLFESPALADNPVLPGRNKLGDVVEDEKYNRALPEIHGVLKKLRRQADQANAVLVGETWTDTMEQLKQYYGDHGDELQMPMDFMFATVNQLSPPAFRRQIAAVEASGGWPVYVLGNHDMVRSYDRYGDGRHNDAIAKLMAAFYLTLRGTPILYYGEEIGMENNDPKRKEDVKDPVGRRGWPAEKGRDGERTPMQWNGNVNAGFSKVPPWLPVPPSYAGHDVAAQRKDPDSILNLYKKVLALRHANPAIREGAYVAVNEDDANVLSYLRAFSGKTVLVALNMSAARRTVTFDLSRNGLRSPHLKPLLVTQHARAEGSRVQLNPFSVFIAQVNWRDSVASGPRYRQNRP